MVKLILALTCLFLAIPCQAEVIVYFPMDSNPNWTTEGQWEFGVPQGGGGPESYDPASGHTGANVFGYNLAGNYGNNIPEYCLTTSALNCALAENVKLSFWRWLGVESSLFDHAKIQVSNDGTNWTDIWVNGGGNLADSSWVYCEYDISAVADIQPTVFVRWCLGPTDFSNAYAGWNIDDVCLDGDILDALFISSSDSFVSLGPEGGPFSPACTSYYWLTNKGDSAITWTAEGTQSWLNVTPSSGTLLPGVSFPVKVCINLNANTLTEGKHTDTVSFTNTNSGFSHLIDVTLYVAEGLCVPLQYPTIQSAINASSNGDTIVVLDGTYTGNGNRDINFNGRAITLKGVSGPESCFIDCEGSWQDPHRGFYFHSGETFQSVVEGFTITGGYVCGPGAGIYCVNSSPTINNCIISGNRTDTLLGGNADGGGIYCNNSSPTVTNCIISQNSGGRRGGGLYCQSNSSPMITSCIIIGNISFTPNITGAGGGMYNDNSNPILTNCTFSGNRSVNGAGMWNDSSKPVLTNCTFSQNSATCGATGHSGGAMYNINSSPTLTNCTFNGNSADEPYALGGGIYNRGGAPTLTNCTFFGNWVSSPDAHGGSIYNWEGKPRLTNCILWGNSDEGGMDESAQIYTTGVGGPAINYSCIQGLDTFAGRGNIGEDPCFADSSNNDYHLKSQAGRWDANSQSWVQDDVSSLCIDAGDPNSDWTAELWPHGKRINMGTYGGMSEASMSPMDIGNIANLNNDLNDIVNSLDLALFVEKWCYEEFLLAEDLNRDGFANFDDFAIFGLHWSYPSASEPRIVYQVDDCNMEAVQSRPVVAESNEPRFSVRVEGNYIYFKDLITANCCADEIELQMTVEDGLITIYEIEHSKAPCTCLCDYPTTASLGPFEPGNYLLEVIDIDGKSLGIVEVTIGGTTEPGITYQIEDCNRDASVIFAATPPDLTRFTVTVEGLYIHFEDMMYANCCPDELELEITVEDNLITIYEIEYTSEGCRCMCSFPITATLGPFEPGTYTLEVYETMGGFIGATTITIGPGE
ncbi:MAG: BACON domain-containing protein [Planctomycetota bacterium]|jgi:NifU-like protein involved in Fe-S cluster formation